jgi:hypothetical protein
MKNLFRRFVVFLGLAAYLATALPPPAYAQGVDVIARAQAANVRAEAIKTHFNVIVIGAKEAGLGAAVGAARLDKDVLLVSENDGVGGQLGGGINQSDVNSTRSPGLLIGYAREFYTELVNAETTDFTLKQWWRSEGPLRPSWVRRQIQRTLARYPNITVLYNTNLSAVTLNNAALSATVVLIDAKGNLKTYTADRIIDGSYTGDLQQKANLSISIGRESTALYGESYAGTKAAGAWTPNVAGIDPYVTAGDSSSGLLYPLRANPSITVGAGDGLVMEPGYRLFFTSVAADKIPIPDPAIYYPQRYELLGRAMAVSPSSFTSLTNILQFYDLQRIGGAAMCSPSCMRYVDINSLGPISTNYPDTDKAKAYITATPAERKLIDADALNGTLGLFKFLKTDARVPAALVTALANYGFSNKEWKPYGGAPREIYLREGARIVGDFVMIQSHATVFANGLTNPIARLYYDLDSHNVQRYVVAGAPKIEGALLVSLGSEAGAPVPVNVLWPKYAESKVTLHPGNPSMSNVVWRSARMGPIELQMGYAAGVNAALSIEDGVAVQDVDLTRLNRIIDIDEVFKGLTSSPDAGTYTQAVRSEITGTGAWSQSADRFGFIGNYAKVISSGSTTRVRYCPNLYDSGWGQWRVMYQPLSNRATNAKYRMPTGYTTIGTSPIATTNASTTVTVTHTAHGLTTGNEVTISGAADTNGIVAANLNGIRAITVVDANTYTVVAGAAATSTGTGGGAVVQITTPSMFAARYLNQQFPGGGGGWWEDLGEVYARKGPSTSDPKSPDCLEIDPTGADGIVSDGGVQFIPVRK